MMKCVLRYDVAFNNIIIIHVHDHLIDRCFMARQQFCIKSLNCTNQYS